MIDTLIPTLVVVSGLATACSAAMGRLRRLTQPGWQWWHGVAVAAGLLNVGLLAIRAYESAPPRWLQHGFDVTLLLATLMLGVGLLAVVLPRLRGLDDIFLLMAALLQATAFVALFRGPERTPSDTPTWFFLHMLTLVMGITCFLAAGLAGGVYLAVNRSLRRKPRPATPNQRPALESLERLSTWMLTLGLPLFTFGILTGVCEMVRAAEPWTWLRDPIVILSFVLWVGYALTLVGIWLRPRNRGRRAAVLSASGVAVVLIVFLVLTLFPATHQ